MKIKSIARVCAQEKRIFIYDQKRSDGELDFQWVGDGCAMYPVFDLPYVEKESIFAIFDIPEKQRNKYLFKHSGLPEQIDYRDTSPCENRIDRGKIEIAVAGRVLKPLETQRGLSFIDVKYLSPLVDMLETLELFERLTADGHVFIVAKSGLMITAVIMPYDIISETFVKEMEELTRQCKFALSNKVQEQQANQETEQTNFDKNGEK